MKLSDFNYDLPTHFIAQTPLKKRDHSKLMILNRATRSIEHHQFFELPDMVPKNSLLVFNQSKVIPARLNFKIGEKKVEILLIKPSTENTWECMVRPGSKFKVGKIITIENELEIEIKAITPHGLRVIEFKTEDLNAFLKKRGQTPLPPYIKEKVEDPNRYQTIYAKGEGSVAAPTAGLHFTDDVLKNLEEKGVETAFVTLHVGLGTFQPVKTENLEEHQMHSEWLEMEEATARKINDAKKEGKNIIAVGTTSVRVLESCSDETGHLEAKTGETDIFITPGYQWKCVDGLITNFHVPKSTLLMLVSALADRKFILEAYEAAKKNSYRFFSFGDAMLIL